MPWSDSQRTRVVGTSPAAPQSSRSPQKVADAQAMTSENPHYLLFSEASQDHCAAQSWRFVLQHVESQRRFSATDSEPSEEGHRAGQERLELLAVVRGLEALDRPARVTLVTKSRYVSRGIKRGLNEWRTSDWRWERFGRVVPVRDHDLWQRVDRALRIHEVCCQAWQFDEPAEAESPAKQPRRCQASRQMESKIHRRRTILRSPSKRNSKRKLTALWSEAWSAVARPMRQTLGATG